VISIRQTSTPRRLLMAVGAPLWATILGCTSPLASSSSSAPPPAAKFAGDYALTIAIDGKCIEFPESLKAWTYQAVLEDHGYLSVQVVGEGFNEPIVVGQLYVLGDSEFRILLNFNYEELDRYPQPPQLLLYGSGDATSRESSISGVIHGDASITGGFGGVRCAGLHRFTFVRHGT
jgi:hypothetical protein